MASRESVRAERCPACGHQHHRNLVYKLAGHPAEVYVLCGACDTFVARYTLSRYTSHETYPGLLERLGIAAGESARGLVQELQGYDKEVAARLRRALELAEQGEDPRPVFAIFEDDEHPGEESRDEDD